MIIVILSVFVYIKGCMSIHIVWFWGCWDTWIQEIKAMSKVSKIFYRFQCFKCYVCQRHQRWYLWLLHSTPYSYSSHVKGVKDVKYYCALYTVASRPCQGGRLFIWAFHLWALAVYHLSVQGGSFVNFLGLVNYKGNCRQDAQPIPQN